MKRRKQKSMRSSSKVVPLRASPEEMRTSYGKNSSTSQDMVLISPTLLATAFLAISAPIFLLTIPLSGSQHSSTKNQKEEKSVQSILCEALNIK